MGWLSKKGRTLFQLLLWSCLFPLLKWGIVSESLSPRLEGALLAPVESRNGACLEKRLPESLWYKFKCCDSTEAPPRCKFVNRLHEYLRLLGFGLPFGFHDAVFCILRSSEGRWRYLYGVPADPDSQIIKSMASWKMAINIQAWLPIGGPDLRRDTEKVRACALQKIIIYIYSIKKSIRHYYWMIPTEISFLWIFHTISSKLCYTEMRLITPEKEKQLIELFIYLLFIYNYLWLKPIWDPKRRCQLTSP